MKQRVGFVSSLLLALIPVLLVAVELAVKAAEPKWPGQSLSTWATLGQVFRATSTIARWLMFPAIIASAFCIQSLALTERKRRSILAIAFTMAAALLLTVFEAVQQIYIPARERPDSLCGKDVGCSSCYRLAGKPRPYCYRTSRRHVWRSIHSVRSIHEA
jgi:hypothetical protein